MTFARALVFASVVLAVALVVRAPAGAVAAPDVLARYERALAGVKQPPAVSFDYAVEQLGLRNMEQTHRVYRSGRSERDETIVVDGYELKVPSIRIIANRNNRYDIAAVAPRPSAYRFVYAGATHEGARVTYAFRTAAFAHAAFSVTEVDIDGAHFLPVTVRFTLAGDGARGSGILSYEPNGGYWVIREALVHAHLASGAVAHEHITWSDYAFPPSLPPSTFEAPKPSAGGDQPAPDTAAGP